jgi:signal transduction histidine kinase
LEISLKEVERLNASVTGVLQLSKAQDSPREAVKLHEILEEAADLVSSRFRRQKVELRLGLDAEADLVLARPGQLKSAALNLMVNALEAQPDGGTLEIRTTLVQMPEMSGPAVSLHFKDGGPGVPAEIRHLIFDPFFTTKNGGAGIGLAMAKQSVEENGGQLELSPSFPSDKGAEFRVIFPLASSAARDEGNVSPRGHWGTRSSRLSDQNPIRVEEERQNKTSGPHFLLTPGGLKTVLPHSDSGPEETD